MMRVLGICALALALTAPAAQARVIERACLSSDRAAVSRTLCRCIQQVANASLTKTDQRKGAKFFKKPQLAQDTRQSDRPSNEAFWQRWKAFGARAADQCS